MDSISVTVTESEDEFQSGGNKDVEEGECDSNFDDDNDLKDTDNSGKIEENEKDHGIIETARPSLLSSSHHEDSTKCGITYVSLTMFNDPDYDEYIGPETEHLQKSKWVDPWEMYKKYNREHRLRKYKKYIKKYLYNDLKDLKDKKLACW